MATRLGRRTVLLGVALAVVLVQTVAVVVGALLGVVLPTRIVAIISAVVFVVIGSWLWWESRGPAAAPPGRDPEDPVARRQAVPAHDRTDRIRVRGVLAVTGAFTLGELGDKTQVATVALASRQDWSATLVGAVVGMIAANALAIEAGTRLARVMDPRRVRQVSAVVFVVVGFAVGVIAVAGG